MQIRCIFNGQNVLRTQLTFSMLDTGTLEDVKRYCQYLIDMAGKEGGYIMSSGGFVDYAQPEHIRAMIDFTKEYGLYE